MARVVRTANAELPGVWAEATVEKADVISRRIGLQHELERLTGVWYRGEVCKRAFDGWRQIHLCNSARGEFFTRPAGKVPHGR